MELLDVLSLRILRVFRLGPWYCNQCESKSYLLKLRRWYRPTQTFDGHSKQRLRSESGTEFESAGNYIKGEQSLVMRDKRATRFSQKYRDGVVLRILSGATTMAQIRQELEISESDVVGWIASLYFRKEAKIDELTDAIEKIQDGLPKDLKLSLEFDKNTSITETENVVDGRIVPK